MPSSALNILLPGNHLVDCVCWATLGYNVFVEWLQIHNYFIQVIKNIDIDIEGCDLKYKKLFEL